MIAIGRPGVVAEVTRASDAYEAALEEGDVEGLISAFWPSELALRFGDDEELYGWAAIAAFRRSVGCAPVVRAVRERRVTAYGDDLASVHIVADYPADRRTGRQSQWWLRTDEGWRIAEAHVSWPLESAVRAGSAIRSRTRPRGDAS